MAPTVCLKKFRLFFLCSLIMVSMVRAQIPTTPYLPLLQKMTMLSGNNPVNEMQDNVCWYLPVDRYDFARYPDSGMYYNSLIYIDKLLNNKRIITAPLNTAVQIQYTAMFYPNYYLRASNPSADTGNYKQFLIRRMAFDWYFATDSSGKNVVGNSSHVMTNMGSDSLSVTNQLSIITPAAIGKYYLFITATLAAPKTKKNQKHSTRFFYTVSPIQVYVTLNPPSFTAMDTGMLASWYGYRYPPAEWYLKAVTWAAGQNTSTGICTSLTTALYNYAKSAKFIYAIGGNSNIPACSTAMNNKVANMNDYILDSCPCKITYCNGMTGSLMWLIKTIGIRDSIAFGINGVNYRGSAGGGFITPSGFSSFDPGFTGNVFPYDSLRQADQPGFCSPKNYESRYFFGDHSFLTHTTSSGSIVYYDPTFGKTYNALSELCYYNLLPFRNSTAEGVSTYFCSKLVYCPFPDLPANCFWNAIGYCTRIPCQ